jgi:hypothetical protein
MKDFLTFVVFVTAGIVGDPASPASFGGWLDYSATYHPWVVSFLVMDLFLFFGVITLTLVQASQVGTLPMFTFSHLSSHLLRSIA